MNCDIGRWKSFDVNNDNFECVPESVGGERRIDSCYATFSGVAADFLPSAASSIHRSR